ncbi:hypothetical protein NEIPOLOT_01046 [Neisseria polysaccharea ATCC 43768]|nr:hypothetical protein NEIPOLOT_01046 [Neisseria polysaccharea ATCC 43768]
MTVQVRTAVGSNQGKAGQAVRKTDVSTHRTAHKASPYESEGIYSGLNLNQYSVASPCRTICTVCGFVALS